MCLIWLLCVSCAVSPINYAYIFASKMWQFIKAEDSKTTLQSRKWKASVPFQRMRIQCSCTLTPYAGLKCLQHHPFLLNPTRDYYCSFCTLVHIKHVGASMELGYTFWQGAFGKNTKTYLDRGHNTSIEGLTKPWSRF